VRFGGWHRLWLVFSLLWAAGVAVAYWSSRQSADELYHAWANELIAYLASNSTELGGYTETSLRSTYSDISDRELVDRLHDKYLPQHPAYSYGFAEIDAKYRPRVESPEGVATLQGHLRWLFVGLGVPLAVYLGGGAIAWIRAGFRRA
jgi:hypothetical protein